MGLNCYMRRFVRVATIHRRFNTLPIHIPRVPLIYKSNLSMTGSTLLIRSPTSLQLSTLIPGLLDTEASEDEDGISRVQERSRD